MSTNPDLLTRVRLFFPDAEKHGYGLTNICISEFIPPNATDKEKRKPLISIRIEHPDNGNYTLQLTDKKAGRLISCNADIEPETLELTLYVFGCPASSNSHTPYPDSTRAYTITRMGVRFGKGVDDAVTPIWNLALEAGLEPTFEKNFGAEVANLVMS